MKKFKTQEIRDLLNQVYHEEISFSRMVEILNEMVSEAEKKCVEDIPVRKFKKGDKVRIKDGVSSKTHIDIGPSFVSGMDEFIGMNLTVAGYTERGCVFFNEDVMEYDFAEDWLEPYTDEPYTDELKRATLRFFGIMKKKSQSLNLMADQMVERKSIFSIKIKTDLGGEMPSSLNQKSSLND